MNKIIKCILGCMLVFMVSGCGTNEDDPINHKSEDIFETVGIDDDATDEMYIVVYHKETKVMYVIIEYYKGVGITPLLNPDGTPMLYQGE